MPEIASERLFARCQPATPDEKTRRGVAKRRLINAERKQKILLLFNCFEFSMKRDQKKCVSVPLIHSIAPSPERRIFKFCSRADDKLSAARFGYAFVGVLPPLHQPRDEKSHGNLRARPDDGRKNSMSGSCEACLMFRSSKPSCVNAILISSNLFF